MTKQRDVKQYMDEEKQQAPEDVNVETEEEKRNWEMI